ncbi:hypothetical protein GLOTRDRAFT_96382 [Gloeophyllum trabeum ATCC 11539]|uniref:WD40 repeat-like protein n=1 Tax=Gloeophyllum trabeum (strain ATCC 11539 / FP-39264 / Madison 617) TaxID=670483 RepID=S7PWG2_GLOTA|nr:uncharacterized protein GLOTRDRAFT_96382 [Gloeophyllum trabeum ATCC 11539]EPQ51672.1 hypothetical protein GLOTRDRAFT_96382 [Gloeophyllum trabeum ATCC 11539]
MASTTDTALRDGKEESVTNVVSSEPPSAPVVEKPIPSTPLETPSVPLAEPPADITTLASPVPEVGSSESNRPHSPAEAPLQGEVAPEGPRTTPVSSGQVASVPAEAPTANTAPRVRRAARMKPQGVRKPKSLLIRRGFDASGPEVSDSAAATSASTTSPSPADASSSSAVNRGRQNAEAGRSTTTRHRSPSVAPSTSTIYQSARDAEAGLSGLKRTHSFTSESFLSNKRAREESVDGERTAYGSSTNREEIVHWLLGQTEEPPSSVPVPSGSLSSETSDIHRAARSLARTASMFTSTASMPPPSRSVTPARQSNRSSLSTRRVDTSQSMRAPSTSRTPSRSRRSSVSSSIRTQSGFALSGSLPSDVTPPTYPVQNEAFASPRYHDLDSRDSRFMWNGHGYCALHGHASVSRLSAGRYFQDLNFTSPYSSKGQEPLDRRHARSALAWTRNDLLVFQRKERLIVKVMWNNGRESDLCKLPKSYDAIRVFEPAGNDIPNTLAVVNTMGNLRLLDVNAAKFYREVAVGDITSAKWQGQTLAIGQEDGTIVNIDPRVKGPGGVLAKRKHHSCWISSLSWRQDGLVLASGDSCGNVLLYDNRHTKMPLTFKPPGLHEHPRETEPWNQSPVEPGVITALAWTPWNPQLVVSAATDFDNDTSEITFWNYGQHWQTRVVPYYRGTSGISSLHFSPIEGVKELVFTLCEPANPSWFDDSVEQGYRPGLQHGVNVLDASTLNQVACSESVGRWVDGSALSPDGTQLACAITRYKKVQIFDIWGKPRREEVKTESFEEC